jgi:hypothetical protein
MRRSKQHHYSITSSAIGAQPICLCHFAVLGSEQLKAEIGEHAHLGRPVVARGEDGVEREKLIGPVREQFN